MSLIWCDLETGGLFPHANPILQIACVVTDFDLNEISPWWVTKVKPTQGLEISEEALRINKIDIDSLSECPDEEFVAGSFTAIADHFKGAKFAGFKCAFDWSFLASCIARNNYEVVKTLAPHYDVHRIAKDRISGLKNYKLTTIAAHFGVDTTGAHEARKDLEMTIEVAKRLKGLSAQNTQQLKLCKQVFGSNSRELTA